MEEVLLGFVLLGGLGWLATSVCLIRAYRRVTEERDTLALALRQRKPSDEERTADFFEPIQWPCPTEAQLIGRRAAKEYNEQILKE